MVVNRRGRGERSRTALRNGRVAHYDKRNSDNGDPAEHERHYSSFYHASVTTHLLITGTFSGPTVVGHKSIALIL